MNYIRYHEVEKLFAVWPTLEAVLESLSVDLMASKTKESTGTDTDEDYIYSLSIGNKAMTSMPPTGKIIDSTGNIAISYMKIMRYDQREVRGSLENDILNISLVIDKLSISFRRLTVLQQQVLKLCYWDKKTWKEILDCLKEKKQYMSLRQAQEQRRMALEKVTKISKITIDVYNHMMRLIDEKIAK